MRTTRILTVMGALILSFGLMAGCDKDEKKAECGNGVLEGNEECDGSQFAAGLSCEGEGFYAGTLTCNNDCTVSTDACHNCGNGVLDQGEECDGAELGGATCEGEGYDYGDMACDAACYLDETDCGYFECFLANFTSMDATAVTDNVEYYYEEVVEDDGLYFLLIVDLYDGGSGVQTGDHTLGEGDEATVTDCMYCLYLLECLDSACSDQDTFYFATAGTMGLDTLGNVGGTIVGDLDSVTMTEWDVDNDEPVMDGDCIDIDAWAVQSDLAQANW